MINSRSIRFWAAFSLLLFALAACAAPGQMPGTSGSAPPARDVSSPEKRISPEALELFTKARLLWDRNENCSDPALALKYLDAAVALEPEYADAYMRRALAANVLGYLDDAFDDSGRAIRLEPKPDNYAYRGLMFMRQGNLMGARMDLEKSLKLDPKNELAKAFMQELRALER